MEQKDKGKKVLQPDLEKEVHDRIEKESPDLTDLVFDLFFNEEFKGNIDPTEDMKNKKRSSE